MHFLPPALPAICTPPCRPLFLPRALHATCTSPPFAPCHVHSPCHLRVPTACTLYHSRLPPMPAICATPLPSSAPPALAPACCQLRRANASRDTRPSSRRYRVRSSSPSRGEPSRRRPRSRSPYHDREPVSDRSDKHSRDSTRRPKRVKPEFFQPGAGSRGGVCAACLGRHEHNFSKCEEPRLWDGSASASRKNEHGRLVAASGLPLCFDWQVPRGCSSSGHPDRHRCTGCGRADHGAQGCP